MWSKYLEREDSKIVGESKSGFIVFLMTCQVISGRLDLFVNPDLRVYLLSSFLLFQMCLWGS